MNRIKIRSSKESLVCHRYGLLPRGFCGCPSSPARRLKIIAKTKNSSWARKSSMN